MAKPSVFVIGAGLAGLACARVLVEAGFLVRVADKGRGPGGRCSSRRSPAGQFDHGASFFTARDPDFRSALDTWIAEGAAAAWTPRLLRGGVPSSPSEPFFLGTPAMNAIIKHGAARVAAEFDLRIAPLAATQSGQHPLTCEAGHQVGEADVVVVATPAPQAVELLPPTSPLRAGAASAELAPCWTLMAAFEGGDPGFDAHLVEGAVVDAVFWQLGRPGREGASRFVLQASPSWSAANLELEAGEVEALLLAELHQLVPGLGEPTHSTAHRWRYARVTKTAPGDFGMDLENGLATCGDWHLGPRVESAWLSGYRLGQALAEAL